MDEELDEFDGRTTHVSRIDCFGKLAFHFNKASVSVVILALVLQRIVKKRSKTTTTGSGIGCLTWLVIMKFGVWIRYWLCVYKKKY